LALYPSRYDWDAARAVAGMATSTHDDMHAGELETSLLLHAVPSLVGADYRMADHQAPDRSLMLTLGVEHYAPTGVIRSPSQASPQKGEAVLQALVARMKPLLEVLRRS